MRTLLIQASNVQPHSKIWPKLIKRMRLSWRPSTRHIRLTCLHYGTSESTACRLVRVSMRVTEHSPTSAIVTQSRVDKTTASTPVPPLHPIFVPSVPLSAVASPRSHDAPEFVDISVANGTPYRLFQTVRLSAYKLALPAFEPSFSQRLSSVKAHPSVRQRCTDTPLLQRGPVTWSFAFWSCLITQGTFWPPKPL